jgi:hypothetical protein
MNQMYDVAELQPLAQELPISPNAIPPARNLAVLYGAVIFLSAFLLFQVQLVIGKYILPLFGGGPSVWNTSLFFFQVLLLLGYAYAHWLSSRPATRTQSRIHLVLLAAALAVVSILWLKWGTPITPGTAWRPQPGGNPVAKILELLSVTVALPFFLLSTTSPLLQDWFARSQGGKSPYRLYALSNVGSLLGLLSYPFLVEWLLTIKHQALLWSSGFIIFALSCAGVAWQFGRRERGAREAQKPISPLDDASPAPGAARYVLWVTLATCSSVMLLSTTNLLCQNIVVIPLLWVVPLSLYLLSFIITFDSDRWYRRVVFIPLYALGLGEGMKTIFEGANFAAIHQIGIFSLALFSVCMVCHGELARSKPAARHLTAFFLLVATGGALGGVFVVLIAPVIFRGLWEFQIALIGCGALLVWSFLMEDRRGRTERAAWVIALATLAYFLRPLVTQRQALVTAGVALIAALIYLRRKRKRAAPIAPNVPWIPAAALAAVALFGFFALQRIQRDTGSMLLQDRNFFGVKYVIKTFDTILMQSGAVQHGYQFIDPAKRDEPTSYYGLKTGVGMLLSNFPRGANGTQPLRVGLIGMGVGTLAAYGKAGDFYRFYEIDPAVIRFSEDTHPYFTFIEDTPAKVETQVGDGRLSLEHELSQGQPQKYDVLIVDAFRGDAIPLHLLTREAMEIYTKELRGPDSVVAFHISNWYLDLAPVVVGLGDSQQMGSIAVSTGAARWIFLSRNPASLTLPKMKEFATPVPMSTPPLLWTDDYSNLLQVLRPEFVKSLYK